MTSRHERVVAAIREARDIHQQWAEWLRERPPGYTTDRSYVGGVTHHNLWVRRYNDTLRELGEQP